MRLRAIRNTVLASEIAEFLGSSLLGDNCAIQGACTVARLRPNAVTYLSPGASLTDALPDEVLVLADQPISAPGLACVVTPTPRADLARVVREFFTDVAAPEVSDHACVSSTARMGRNVHVGHGAVVDNDVVVGDGCVVLDAAVLRGRTELGPGCLVKTHASIGTESFGFVDGPGGRECRPEVGTIILGARVWVGANTTIERAGLADTIIDDDVRIDDLVHVGSDVTLGRGVRIEAGSVICRGVSIGADSLLGPRVVVAQGCSIGTRVVIGAGAVVLHDVPDGTVAVGSPARVIRPSTAADLEDPGF